MTATAIATETIDNLKHQIVDFVATASIEVSPQHEALLPVLAATMPPGATLYIAHPPRRQLRDVVRTAINAQRLGLKARPHIIARALDSEQHLRDALSELNAAGITQILLIAGDRSAASGPFSSTLELLATGATVDCGMTTVAVAGHPEGHRSIGPSLLWDALLAKQAFAQRTGTNVEVITQFGFDPHAIFEWLRRGREQGISLPVHVGIAGPTPLPKLIRFAMECGIKVLLHSLMNNTSAMTGLVRVAATPDEMLVSLVQGREASATADAAAAIVAPHFFCFGGSVETAQWLRGVMDGEFELNADSARFSRRR